MRSDPRPRAQESFQWLLSLFSHPSADTNGLSRTSKFGSIGRRVGSRENSRFWLSPHARGVAKSRRAPWYIPGDDAASPDYGVVSYRNAGQNNGAAANRSRDRAGRQASFASEFA